VIFIVSLKDNDAIILFYVEKWVNSGSREIKMFQRKPYSIFATIRVTTEM